MSQEDLSEYLDSLLERYREVPNNLARIILSHPEAGTGLDYLDGMGVRHFSLDELGESSARLAHYLAEHGLERGDRVGVLLPKTPELLIAALAIWRLGACYLPLFTAFGSDAISYRANDAACKYIVTDPTNATKLDANALGDCRILVTGATVPEGAESFSAAIAGPRQDGFVEIGPEEMLVLIYTSGTTGTPKGVPVPMWALAGLEAYMTLGIGLSAEDKYWNLADPGWAYGLYYGVIAPLALGHSILFVNLGFDPKGVVELWQRFGITSFAGAPTAFRSMRSAIGDTPVVSQLRNISSAGEPLNPEVIAWSKANLGVEIRDHYGQTEIGMVINNHNDPRLRNELIPGSMGMPTPGITAVILDSSFSPLGPGVDGEVAIDTQNSRLFWFGGYFNAPGKTAERHSPDGRYYLTGDVASRDEAGYFFFSGRSDDVILTSGYRVGPFEVESAVLAHPKVAECAVVGVPDEMRGEAIWAYVVLRAGESDDGLLVGEVQDLVRSRLSRTSYPRRVLVVDELPKTPSGKIQRYILRSKASSVGG